MIRRSPALEVLDRPLTPPVVPLPIDPLPVDEGGPVVRCMSDIDAVDVRWLIRATIPSGRISLLSGIPGAGKSMLVCDLAARVSTGTPWPNGSPIEQGSVLLVSAEDDPADTLRPRLDAARADCDRIHLLTGVRRVMPEGGVSERVFTLADIPELERAMASIPDLRLVVIDPIGSYLGGDVDSHRDNETRGVLSPLAMLAARYDVAVLIVAHRRKSLGQGNADETVLGSRAFVGIARSVLHLLRDPDVKGRRLLLPGKCNLGPEADGLAFSIVGQPVGSVQWERDPVSMTADECLVAERESSDGRGRPDDERRGAVEWLERELAGGAPKQVPELKKSAAGAGLSWRTVQRAADKLQVKRELATFGGNYTWRIVVPVTDKDVLGRIGPVPPVVPEGDDNS